jgi:hypothetical protein
MGIVGGEIIKMGKIWCHRRCWSGLPFSWGAIPTIGVEGCKKAGTESSGCNVSLGR